MKKIPVFLSSTFNDMQAERDIMRFNIEKNINDIAKKNDVHASFVDLRWGVNVNAIEEKDYDRKVLEICLGEVKQTKPYFIAFLGERYGWIPSDEDVLAVTYQAVVNKEEYVDKSVTEIEIKYALDCFTDHSKCLFYFRKPVNFDDDLNARDKYVSRGHDYEKLQKIKEYLVKNFPTQVKEYSAEWDKQSQSFVLEHDFERKVTQDVLKVLSNEFVYDEEENEFSIRKRQINYLVEKNAREFIGRKALLSEVFFKIDKNDNKIIEIVSDTAKGKTFLLSKIAKELNNEKNLVLQYFCNQWENKLDYKGLLNYFLNILDIKSDEEMSSKQLLDTFREKINYISDNKKVYIIIDDIDSLITNRECLNFLNVFSYNNVKFIVSINKNHFARKYFSAMGCDSVEIGDYTTEDIIDVSNRFFKENSRQIGTKLIDAIITKENKDNGTSANPFFLSMLLQNLNNLSKNDFKQINELVELNGKSFATNIENFQIGLIEKSGKNLYDAINIFLNDVQTKIPLFNIFIDILNCAPNGINHRQIEFVLKQLGYNAYQYEFSLFLQAFEMFLVKDNRGNWHYSQEVVKTLLKNRTSIECKKKVLNAIVKYYEEETDETESRKYLLDCFLELCEYDKVYQFLIENSRYKNFEVVQCLNRFIENNKNCFYVFSYLKKIDKSNFLAYIYNQLVGTNISIQNAKKLLNIIYPKNKIRQISQDKEQKGILYNNLVCYAKLCFSQEKYKYSYDTAKYVSKIFKNYQTKRFSNYEIKVIENLSAVYIGKKPDTSGLNYLIYDWKELLSTRKNDETNFKYNRLKTLKLLNTLKKMWNELSETKYDSSFLANIEINELLDLGYLSKEERYYWISEKVAFSGDFIHSINQGSGLDDVVAKEERQFNELLEYVEDEESDKDTVFLCCLNLSKYYDKITVVENNFKYTKKALEIAENKFNEQMSADNVLNYLNVLQQRFCEEVIEETEKTETIEKILKIAKINALVNPCVESYDKVEDAYSIYEYKNELDKKEKKERERYKNRRKKITYKKQDFDWCQTKIIMTIFVSIALIIGTGILFYVCHAIGLPSVTIKVIFLYLLASTLIGASLAIIVREIIKNGKNLQILKTITCLIIFVISIFAVFMYEIPDADAKKFALEFGCSGNNVVYFVKYGGKQIFLYLLQTIIVLTPIWSGIFASFMHIRENNIGRFIKSKAKKVRMFLNNNEKKEKKIFKFLKLSTILFAVVQLVSYFMIKKVKYMQLININVSLVCLALNVAILIIDILFLALIKNNVIKQIQKEKQKVKGKR